MLDPLTRLVSLHMITHLSQDDGAAKWMALAFPSEQLCSSLEGYLFDGHGDCRREEWSRSDEEKVWLLGSSPAAMHSQAPARQHVAERLRWFKPRPQVAGFFTLLLLPYETSAVKPLPRESRRPPPSP